MVLNLLGYITDGEEFSCLGLDSYDTGLVKDHLVIPENNCIGRAQVNGQLVS